MLYGISGFKGSGKGTCADFLVANGYTKISFADKLKDACSTIFEWDRDLLEGVTDESRIWREEVDEWWAERLRIPEFCPRLALQWMGTEAGRKVFGQDIWCAALEKYILEHPADYVIPDVRFANEVKLIHSMRGITIRIKRGPEPNWYEPALEWNLINKTNPDNHVVIPKCVDDIHESERDWIGEKFDHIIENNSTLEELETKLDKIITE